MREIKFRIWNVEDKKMSIPFDLEDYANDQDREYGNGNFDLNNYPPMSKNILMQFTGLHDKNGKEVYEGDIVEYGGVNFIIESKMEFNCGCCSYVFGWNFPNDEEKYLEVIGNIYENPDLLQAGGK